MEKANSESIFDIIVVGGGVEGLSTAYNSARNGQRTLLLEQFLLPHTRGSSHGQTRIIRKTYADDFYVSMMQDAYRMWCDLEKEAEYPIFLKQVGLLTFGMKPNGVLEKTDQSMVKAGVVFQRLNTEQLRTRFPMMAFDGDFDSIYEPSGGVLKADSILQVYQRLFKKDGGIVNDGEKVESITPGDLVTVKTSRDTYKARSVVIATGPWATRLLKPLGIDIDLKPVLSRVFYWKPKTDLYTPDAGFPCIVMTHQDPSKPGSHVYGFPAIEYPNLVKVYVSSGSGRGMYLMNYFPFIKICVASEEMIDPDVRDELVRDTRDEDSLIQFIRKFMPGLEDRPRILENCISTKTLDEHFIIDTHPDWKNIVIGVGFSGHGFKLAPVIGKVLSEMAMGRKLSYDITPFRISRFSEKTAKARL